MAESHDHSDHEHGHLHEEECTTHVPRNVHDGHSHGDSHGGHSHGRGASGSKLLTVIIMTGTLMLLEVVVGLWAHSLALVADAGHMLSDLASQGLALLAMWFSAKPPTTGKTYGYYRTEILASLINGVILVVISLFIIYEAIHRLAAPPEIQSVPVILVATAGLIVNAISMRILHGYADASLNMKAAYLELMGDLLASGGVLLAAGIMYFTHWYMVDSIISILIGLMILPRTWLLLAESTNILMEGVPGHIDVEGLRVALLKVPGVVDVHDMHVWTITSGLDAMSGHICVSSERDWHAVLDEVTKIARADFHIQHTTFQVEPVQASSS